jgi:phage regulator Rha-like protein
MNPISREESYPMSNVIAKDTIETIPSYEVAEMMDKPHKDVLAMIHGNSQRKGIIQVLAEIQMYPSDYFIESTYIDASGKENVCYECTKLGCDMLANKMTGEKGIIFTAKYVKAFNDMQKVIEQVGQLVQQPQAQIGPRYSYNNYWIKRELSVIKPTDIPEYIEGLLEHIKSNKAADRLATYEIARAALQDLQPTFLEAWQREMVQSSINKLNGLIELQRSYLNRADKGAKTKRINSLEQDNRELAEELDHWRTYAEELEGNQGNEEEGFYLIEKSGFSTNYMYSWSNGKVVKSNAYRRWINDLHLELYLPKHYPNVDFTRPIRITALFGQKEGMDTNNFGKSLIDQIANYYGFDDCLVYDSRMLLHDFVESYEDGYIFIRIENI